MYQELNSKAKKKTNKNPQIKKRKDIRTTTKKKPCIKIRLID